MLNIALTNLGKYNEGELVFKWLELPVNQKEIDNTLKKIGVDGVEYEEYFISDYETDIECLEVDEYDSVDELNELAELLDGLDTDDMNKLSAITECEGGSISDYINDLDDYILYTDINSEEELGNYWLFDSGCYEVPEFLEFYIDAEKFGSDLLMNGNGFITSYGYIERC